MRIGKPITYRLAAGALALTAGLVCRGTLAQVLPWGLALGGVLAAILALSRPTSGDDSDD